MGLLESVLGALFGGGRGGQQDVLGSVIGGLIQQAGGVGGLLDKFRQAGLGAQADSWQSTGENLPIDPADLMRVLGGLAGGEQGSGGASGSGLGGLLGQVLGGSAPSGMDQNQLGGLLAEVLPQVLDKMTPGGQLPQDESPDMLQSVIGEVLKNIGGGQGSRGLFG
ncbi:MAG: YidB family protein [Casimicrobiaceae bacterium]|nr:YidB family protein [Casimicrobiaceae bacterium]MDW8313217.1 YidB family protein [Burkholderiales bacterium]